MAQNGFLDAVAGGGGEYSAERRLFNLMCAVEGTAIVLFTVDNLLVGFGWPLVLADVIGIVVLGLSYFVGRTRERFEWIILPLWIVMMAVIATTWFFNGGLGGSAIYPAVTGLVILLLVARERTKYLLLVLTIVILAALMVVEHLQPALVVPYRSQDERFVDLLVTIVPTLLIMGLLLIFYARNVPSRTRSGG